MLESNWWDVIGRERSDAMRELRDGMYEFILVLQLAFYMLAALGLFRTKFGVVSRLSDISLAFLVLNAAAGAAFFYFIAGKKAVWART